MWRDAYQFAECGVMVHTADPRLRDFMRRIWSRQRTADGRARHIRLVIRVHDRRPVPSLRLRGWRSLVTDTVVVLSDGKRYLLTGYMYDAPWQFDVRALRAWNPAFVYYQVVEPVLLDALKRWGVLVLHSAAVERGGSAIVLPGGSGSGKSTTALNLLSLGYRLMADDLSILRERAGAWRVDAADGRAGVYLGHVSYARLTEWHRWRRGGRVKRGARWKHRIDNRSAQSARTRVRLGCLLFPRVVDRERTRLESLTTSAALLECLRQAPTEFPASVLGPAAIEKQFELYASLVGAVPCYRIHLGRDQQHVREVLRLLPDGRR